MRNAILAGIISLLYLLAYVIACHVVGVPYDVGLEIIVLYWVILNGLNAEVVNENS